MATKRWLLLGVALAAAPAVRAQNVIGEVFASDASVRGSVVLSGNGAHVLSGSQVSAGDGVALLKLERGGAVRICPKTNLSLSADASGKALVLGLDAGSMELDYSLNSAADLLITPDFRLQLISPGTFHLAISVAPSGDTCMRSLRGNNASVFVAEMMGGDSYQLAPGKNVMFRAGKISGASEAPPMCGCPELKAETSDSSAELAPVPGQAAGAQGEMASETATKAEGEAARKLANNSTNNATSDVTGNPVQQHLEADSTFVYQGNEAVQDTYSTVARLSLSTDNSRLTLALLPTVQGPQATSKPPEKIRGRFRRFGSYLGRLLTNK